MWSQSSLRGHSSSPSSRSRMDQALMECVAEDEVVVSPLSVAEMWQRLPSLVVEETFGYFILQNARRLSGVGTTWKSLLSHLAGINKGILFFRQPKRKAFHSKKRCVCWYGFSLFRQGTVKHIVLQEVLPSPHTYVHSGSDQKVGVMDYTDCLDPLHNLCRSLREAHQAVDIITIYKGVCHPVLQSIPPGESDIRWMFSSFTTLQSVRFVRCTVKIEITSFPRAEGKANDYSGWTWSCWMELPVKVLTRGEMKQLENHFRKELRRRTKYLDRRDFDGAVNKYHSRFNAIECQLDHLWFLEWFLASRSLVSALLWPYPVEQLHWLKAALGALDAPTGKRVFDAYSSYRHDRDYEMIRPGKNGDPEKNWRGNWHVAECSDFKKEWQVDVDIRWGTSDRKLDVIDCAFMAQLLSTMPGVPKPPYIVPFDLKAREDWRETPTPDEVLVELERDITQFKLRTSALLK